MFSMSRGAAMAAVVVIIASRPAAAQNYLNTSAFSWGSASSWVSGAIPFSTTSTAASTQASRIIFPASASTITVNNLPGLVPVNRLYFDSGSGTHMLSGNMLSFSDATWGSPATIYAYSTANVSNPIRLEGGHHGVVLDYGASLGLTGVITSLPGAGTFTIAGPGTVTLNNTANSWTTPIVVNGGAILQLGHADAVRTAASLTLAAGGEGVTLRYIGNTVIEHANLLYGGSDLTVNTNGFNGQLNTMRPAVAYGSAMMKTGGGSLTVIGRIEGPVSLTLAQGTMTFQAGHYLGIGTVAVNAGTILVLNGAPLLIGTGVDPMNYYAATLSITRGTVSVGVGGTALCPQRLTMTGGTVDLGPGRLVFVPQSISDPNMLMTVAPSNTTARLLGDVGAELTHATNTPFPNVTLHVPLGTVPTGIELDIGVRLRGSFTKTGSGTMRQQFASPNAVITVAGGWLQVTDAAALGTAVTTLDGGGVRYIPSTGSGTFDRPLLITGSGGSLDVPAGNTVEALPMLTGFGPFTKSGGGTVVWKPGDAATSLTSFTVNAGQLSIDRDNALGLPLATATVQNGGSLLITKATTTSRTFVLNGSASITITTPLTLNGATIYGGYLTGTGGYGTVAGGLSTITGATTSPSSTFSILGSGDNFIQMTHGGGMTVESTGLANLTGFTVTPSGILTVRGQANVSDLVSSGRITLTGSPAGKLFNLGAGSIVLAAGSTTFIGSPAAPGGTFVVGTSPLLVRGGLLANYGSIGNFAGTGQVVVDYGGRVKGTGYFDMSPITQNGGVFSPGSSPGRATVGRFEFNSGGVYEFEIDNAIGIAGPNYAAGEHGWDLTVVRNALNAANSAIDVTATAGAPFTLRVITHTATGAPDTMGPMANFNPTVPYLWLAFDLDPAGTVNGWDPAAIAIDRVGFANTAAGELSLVRSGNQIFLAFSPVPEPAFLIAAFVVCSMGTRLFRPRMA